MSEGEVPGVTIYVLPTEEGQPPKAVLGTVVKDDDGDDALVGMEAVWSADTGVWMIAGMPAPQDLSEAITDHAKELGVEW